MKYGELIQFNPIQTVIQLKEADDKSRAKGLVESYVMSNDMADKLDCGILRELQFEEVLDNKGVLIVGNYGTGKSHLMSVISSVAVDAGNRSYLQNERFKEHTEKIAGKFEVIRVEIGAVRRSLRNIITSEIEQDLEKRDILYRFPSEEDITNNKICFEEMMGAFEERYPDKGYLLVIDELLDYLGGRREHELRLDLGFLRELGEFIKNSRFRLICGIQEQLFENPRFSFASQSLNRVKDRFEQIIIRKEDTAYVVSQRILSKTPEQKAFIREHLQQFCSLYTNMSENIEEYVDLYPIHPSYIEIFNKIDIAEKREVLKTISRTVEDILQEDVPTHAPGIKSFDTYWTFIKNNYARKSEAGVKEVMEKSSVLEDKIARSFPKATYKPMALQIINALSVYRLTTSGIDIRIGLNVDNLKDDLCLFIPNMPEMEAEFLLSTIQIVMRDIINQVSGQFIEFNPDNGQYFLDLKKDIDYDAKINQKASIMEDLSLNKYFYTVVYECLEWDAQQHVPNFEIYDYRLQWESHNVFRRGYLFMGLPKERSTAQPPQDFYMYILPPYGEREFEDEKKADEVFFDFVGDSTFYNHLKLFAAALTMKDLASEQNTRGIYNKKAEGFKKILKKWLEENKNTCFKVYYKGVQKQLIEITSGKTLSGFNFKDTIDKVASTCLEDYFYNKYPDFPRLKTKITENNLAALLERVKQYFIGKKAQDSRLILESFNLIQDGNISTTHSKYAMFIAKALHKLPPQGVINYSDLIEEVYDESYDKQFKLNKEYLIIILLALVHTGQATLHLKNGTTLTASNLDILQRIGFSDLYDFKYVGKPKQLAIEELKQLCTVLDLPQGLLANSTQLETGLTKINETTKNIAIECIKAIQYLKESVVLWDERIIPEAIAEQYEDNLRQVSDVFSNFSNKYNTVAKLNNFNMSLEEIQNIADGIKVLHKVKEYQAFSNSVINMISYMINIEGLTLPVPLMESIQKAKETIAHYRNQISQGAKGDLLAQQMLQNLNAIKSAYIDYYCEQHQRCRLGINDAKKKGDILNSKALLTLKKLVQIQNVFPTNKLIQLEQQLSGLSVCYELTSKDLVNKVSCPYCGFKLNTNTHPVSGQLDLIQDNLENLVDEWTSILISALSDPFVLQNKGLLKSDQQIVVDTFMSSKVLPTSVNTHFINTMNTMFMELDKVVLDANALINTLTALGPCTIDDFKYKLNQIVDEIAQNHNKATLRIIIQSTNNVIDLVAEEVAIGLDIRE